MVRVAVVLGLAVAACGSSTPPPAGEASETVKRYFAALSRGDVPGVCRELSPAARDDAASAGHASSCESAMTGVAKSIEPELLRNLALARIGPAKVDGGKATVRVTSDDAYAREKQTVTVPLEARDGRWVISRLPNQQMSSDPVTDCVVGGLESWKKSEVDPYWQREGRGHFAAYLGRVCKRAYEEGVYDENTADLSAAQNRRLDRIGDQVLDEMVRSGILKRP